MKSSLKVVTVPGTRPEIIRLSRVMALLDRHLDYRIVHTGQNYDYELNEIFFKDISWQVLKLIMGTAKLSNRWAGIVKNDLNG